MIRIVTAHYPKFPTMRPTLFIHFHHLTSVDWTIFDSQQRLVQHVAETTLATIPIDKNQQVIVLLPNTEILLTQVTLPTTQRQRLQQAVPYALEEQLAEDIEQLHFALGQRDAQQRLAVAIIAQRHLDSYLNALREHQLFPTVVMPEVLALPLISESWSVSQYGQRVLVRTEKQAGFAIDEENLQNILPLMTLPSQIIVWGKLSESVREAFNSLNMPIIEKIRDEIFLISNNYRTVPINLLQGKYQPVSQTAHLWRPWRLTVALLLIFSCIEIGKLGLYYNQLEQQAQALNQQIEQIYRQTFPQAQKIVNPRVQMEQQLIELKGKAKNTQAGNFLILLNQLSPALSKVTSLNLKEISYQSGKLELSLEVADLATLESLKRYVKEAGMNAVISPSGGESKVVRAKLQVES
jgi:general secretion pathway protein L